MSADAPQATAPDPISRSSMSSSSGGSSPVSAKSKESIYTEMVALDTRVLRLLKSAEPKVIRPSRPDAGPEETMARSFELSTCMVMAVTELVLHQRSAFPEVAFFTKKLCGLPKLKAEDWGTAQPDQFGIEPSAASSYQPSDRDQSGRSMNSSSAGESPMPSFEHQSSSMGFDSHSTTFDGHLRSSFNPNLSSPKQPISVPSFTLQQQPSQPVW